jgi:hypothetical protein
VKTRLVRGQGDDALVMTGATKTLMPTSSMITAVMVRLLMINKTTMCMTDKSDAFDCKFLACEDAVGARAGDDARDVALLRLNHSYQVPISHNVYNASTDGQQERLCP